MVCIVFEGVIRKSKGRKGGKGRKSCLKVTMMTMSMSSNDYHQCIVYFETLLFTVVNI